MQKTSNLSDETIDDCCSPGHRHCRTSSAMYSTSSPPSTFSTFEKFETDRVEASLFSEDSPLLVGFNWELNDLLNKEDNDGSDCLDAEAAPAKAAGWNDRFGICRATRERI